MEMRGKRLSSGDTVLFSDMGSGPEFWLRVSSAESRVSVSQLVLTGSEWFQSKRALTRLRVAGHGGLFLGQPSQLLPDGLDQGGGGVGGG